MKVLSDVKPIKFAVRKIAQSRFFVNYLLMYTLISLQLACQVLLWFLGRAEESFGEFFKVRGENLRD